MNEDLNLISLIETISKLKATVSVLVGDKKTTVHKIQNKYFSNNTLEIDDDDNPGAN